VEPGGERHDVLCVHAAQAVTQLGRGGVDHGVQLVGGRGTGLDGAAPGNAQQPDRLHRPALGLGGAGRLTSQHGPGGADRVGRVGLAVPAAMLAIRTRHLDHRHALGGEVAGQAPPRAGALNTNGDDRTEGAQPAQQPPVASWCRREHLSAQHPLALREQLQQLVDDELGLVDLDVVTGVVDGHDGR
jgi:hypothetical protein